MERSGESCLRGRKNAAGVAAQQGVIHGGFVDLLHHSRTSLVRRRRCTEDHQFGLGRGDREEVPFSGHPLEFVSAAFLELESGPDHEVAQRAGHQHLVRPGQGAHARPDVHANTADVVAADLALAGVQPSPYLMPNACTESRIAIAQRIAR